MPLPATIPPITDEQREAIESTDSMLRGAGALSIFKDNLKAQGIEIPSDYRWRKRDANAVLTASHAVFELIGGVPQMALWASKNPNLFYPTLMKMSGSEEAKAMGMAVHIHTNVPDSPLDQIEIDEQGNIITPGFK